ncbi:MAG: dicarboxylate/amino acid:cation symporter [Lachnospiraceae bacterium]|nr:dicarboxylate/amino acid:cation symporter [Lachnospiraceae bacterium]
MFGLTLAQWVSILAIAITGLLFLLLNEMAKRISWTAVVLLSLVLGVLVGILFASDSGEYLVWVELIGSIYINLILALAAPVILVSIITGFVSLQNRQKMKTVGLKSVFWLLFGSLVAAALALVTGLIFSVGKGAGDLFAGIAQVRESQVSAYEALARPFSEVLEGLFPSNLILDIANTNIVAVILIGLMVALACIGAIRDGQGEKVKPFLDFVEALRIVLYRILEYVIDLTPFAVLCLIAGSAGRMISSGESVAQLLILLALIYLVCLVHTYLYNGILVRVKGGTSPFRFFKAMIPAQLTAFTTQSSIATIPVTTRCITKDMRVRDEIAGFTVPLGTTIGMPGCTCIWPVLLVIFYVNAAGLSWQLPDFIRMGVIAVVLSLGSAGVPGIGVVSAVALFTALDLPVAAVVLMLPINTITDMIRTVDNATTAATAAVLVDRVASETEEAGVREEERI